jgi:protein-S-isoprenylcysteine O-methyltransferase Ste14
MLIPMIWKALYWAWIVTEVLVLVVTRTRRGGGDISDRGSLAVLWVVIVCSVTLGFWAGAVYTPAAFHAGSWLRYLCLGMMVLGLVIRWTAIYTLGKAFSANVAIHSTQKLNRSGLFRFMRHPSYTGMVLIFVAMGMSTRNWLGLALFVVPPVVALLYRIHVEEEALTGAFGADYVEYSRTTKRLIPGIY